jgi:glycosyltransferase involved in cell wall biosynthesis
LSYLIGKRILFICDYDEGGVGQSFSQQVRLFRERGLEVWTFILRQTGAEGWSSQDFICRVSGSGFVRHATKFSFDFHVYSALRQVVQQIQPNLVYLNTYAFAPLPVLYALAGQLVVHTVHSMELVCTTSVPVHRDDMQPCEAGVGMKCAQHRCIHHAFLVPHWAMHTIRNLMVRKVVSVFLAPSRNVANYLRAFGFQNVYVLPHFLPQDSYSNVPYPYDRANILSVSSLEFFKGIQFLIQTMPMVLEDFPKATLTVVGDGSWRVRLQAMCQQMGIANQVNFVGRVPHHDISRFYRQSNICVVPSLYESFSRVCIEAMAHGRPVVATNRGGVPELIEDGERGYLVDPMDTAGLAERIRYLVGNSEKAEAMGRKGAEHVRINLCPDVYFYRFGKVLAEFL